MLPYSGTDNDLKRGQLKGSELLEPVGLSTDLLRKNQIWAESPILFIN